ncbi:hypothetical protein EJ110_NYTH26099 [Nymphaea thermarum]|nr:hypothetical protein EJ110_NYTH26099 [Nymphaea thermarum]
MKVPPPPKKRNITFRYDINTTLSEAGLPSFSLVGRQKKLRRLPHIFNRVLELPFNSEANVSVQENHDCFRFVLITDQITEDVEAQLVEIVPGVSKIVVRGRNLLELSLDELELDRWRFRLPPSTRPELATAAYIAGELIVTVPKSVELEDDDGVSEGEEEIDQNGNDGGSLPDAGSQAGSGGEGRGASAGASTNFQELDCKTNATNSQGSSVQHLVLVQ